MLYALLISLPCSAGVIGTFTVDTLNNTAGCPFSGSASDRNPYVCPTALPPGPFYINVPAGDYRLTAISFGSAGPGNIYLWDGDASSGTSLATPRVLDGTLDFTHTIGQIVLYDYDWFPFDNNPLESTTLRLETQSAADTPEPGTIGLITVGLVGFVFRRRQKTLA